MIRGGDVERAVLAGIGLLRTVALFWMVIVLVAQRNDLGSGWHAELAAVLVSLAAMVTIWLAALGANRPSALLAPSPVFVELAVGLALVALDGVVYRHGHFGSGQSSLAVAWPLAGVLSAGVAMGEWAGLVSGLGVGIARLASAPLNGAPLSSLHSPEIVSVLSTAVLYTLAGVVAGYAMELLRRADDEIARARARDEVSRALHDGVLQTLALVERRTSDPQLAGMAREQDRELRAFLAQFTNSNDIPVGNHNRLRPLRRRRLAAVGRGYVEEQLRVISSRFEVTYGARVEVVVVPDLGPMERAKVEALSGAVTEALANAGKHGRASRVTVFVEPTGGGAVFCSVKDNGVGFEAEAISPGLGISGSIIGRVADVGGRVEIDGGPGHGAEVRLWM